MGAMSSRVIDCDRDIFARNFNELPHEVHHTLAGNSLFQLPALVDLAKRVAVRENPHRPQGDFYFDQGAVDTNSKLDLTDPKRSNTTQLVKEIENGHVWIILKHIEREPEYQKVFESCVCDILDLTGKEIVSSIKWFEAILFITSPNRVTDYHIDRECSWLLQIQGNKDIHLFNRGDKDVLPDDELERYWAVDNLCAVHKPQYESRAMVFHMQPGTGIHSPVNTPHWLKNGDNVSVSLNINFQFEERAWENLFKANYYLRRAGLTPSSPGKRPFADRVKRGAFNAAQRIQRSLKSRPTVYTEARKEYHRILEILEAR